MKKQFSITLIALSALVLLAACKKSANTFPTKGITVICPWSEGGGTDEVLRALCTTAEKYLDTTITVENKTGEAGIIGHAAIKDAAPDGYTLGMITLELNSMSLQGLADFSYKDFDPLIRVNADAATLTVPAAAPYNTVAEFVQYCKENPYTVSIGNAAAGSVWHISALLFAEATNIEVKHIPFEGAAGAVTAVASGYIDAVTVSFAEVKKQLDSGKVKVLGIMDNSRIEMYPDIPTFKEQGFDLEYATWRGLALPKGVDSSIKATLETAFTKAITDSDFLATANELHLHIAFQPSQEFAAFLQDNYEAVSKTLKAIHLTE